MSHLANLIGAGFMGVLMEAGIKIDRIDEKSNIWYMTIPEDSHAYHRENAPAGIKDSETFMVRLKETVNAICNSQIRIRYKILPGVVWTKEMGDAYWKKHLPDVMNSIRW